MDIHTSNGTEKTHTKFTVFFLMGHGADHPHDPSAGLGMCWNHIPSHFCTRKWMSWSDL